MDLTTRYLGFDLKNPLIASAGPLTRSVDKIRELEDRGAAAVVLPSLFEEQIRMESESLHHYLLEGAESYAEATSYFPDLSDYNAGPRRYLETIREAREAVDIPVIASLNGHTLGGWIDYAREMEQAGASALELNIYFLAMDPAVSGASVEDSYAEIVGEVRKHVAVPVAVKLAPFFSAFGHLAKRLVEAGANGLVLFNRFYQPDIDLETLDLVPSLELSDSYASRLSLHWIGLLRGRVQADFAATSGVHAAEDALKLIMAGADATMMCSALLKNGAGHIRHVLADLKHWMEEREYSSISEMKGSMSALRVADATALERVNYIRTLESYKVTA